MSDQGSFPNYGANDSNGYPLPGYEQHMSRFPIHSWRFSSAAEAAPQGDGSGDSYDRGLAHTRPLPDIREVVPSDNGSGRDDWAFSHPDNFVAYQPAGPHLGSSHVAPTNSGPALVTEYVPYYGLDVRLGGSSTGPVRDQQPQMTAQAPQQGNRRAEEIQGGAGRPAWIHRYPGHFADFQPTSDGRPAYGQTLQEFHASYAASLGNAQYPHPNTAPSNAQYEHSRTYVPSSTPRQASSPAVRPRGPVGPSVEATRFLPQPALGSRLLQRAAGLRGAGHSSSEAAPNPPQSPNGTLPETGAPDANAQRIMQTQLRAMEMARNLAHRRTMLADTYRKPSPAPITRYTVLLASDPSHDPECPICQDQYDDHEHVAIKLLKTACNHVFGLECLQEWVNSGMDNAHRCPNCRQSIAEALDLPERSSNAVTEAELQQRVRQAMQAMRQGVGRQPGAPQPPQPQRQPVVTDSQLYIAQQRTILRRRETVAAEHRRRRDAEAAATFAARAQVETRVQQPRVLEEARPAFAAPAGRPMASPSPSLRSLQRAKARHAEMMQRRQREIDARMLLQREQQRLAARARRT